MATNIKAGSVAGTGAAINVSVGFEPSYVKIFNATTRVQLEWFAGMTAGHALKTGADGARSMITSNGISLYKQGTNPAGFTIGTDATNADGNTLRFLAVENGPGS